MIRLIRVTAEHARQIEEYRAAFPADRERVTPDPERIPGLDRLEEYGSVEEWLRFCEGMAGKIEWYLSVRPKDGRTVGALVLRRSLEYDDDDPEFSSHIGYSVRPDERGKGYAREQLRLGLQAARRNGLGTVRLVCLDTNIGSIRTILSNGGVYIDTIRGEESGMNVNRYNIRTGNADAEKRACPRD